MSECVNECMSALVNKCEGVELAVVSFIARIIISSFPSPTGIHRRQRLPKPAKSESAKRKHWCVLAPNLYGEQHTSRNASRVGVRGDRM